MIRIRYTFQSVENGIRWNDFLTDAPTPRQALQSFAKIGPKYMLQNLVDMRLFSVDKTQFHTVENLIEDQEEDVSSFIAEMKG